MEIDDPIPMFALLREEREPWRLRAACRGMGIDVFFQNPPAGRPRTDRAEPEAPKVCARCPVAVECDEYRKALPFLVYGWWAGVRYRRGIPQP